jgi:hypothetical protein
MAVLDLIEEGAKLAAGFFWAGRKHRKSNLLHPAQNRRL